MSNKKGTPTQKATGRMVIGEGMVKKGGVNVKPTTPPPPPPKGQGGTLYKIPRKDWRGTDNIKSKDYPFQPAVDLWNLGLVPSFDGTTWRLYGGPKADVLFSITAEELYKGR